MKNFTKPIPQSLLNIEEKIRSNLFTWRGQFSPQLIDCLLEAYCSIDSVVLDPFSGSGTVLYESAKMGFPAFGFEINPSAWCFSKIYEFSNQSDKAREFSISELRSAIENEFPIIIFSEELISLEEVEEKIVRIGNSISDSSKILCNALVVLLDIYNNPITGDIVQSKFGSLVRLVRDLPFSSKEIKADLQDARSLPLEDESIGFVVTSPPYINVFNYHQNYRKSTELLGWDILRVARSEIGSNRANRGNRFYTVIQYCIDIAMALNELCRVLDSDGRVVFIVGHESRVLGVPFYNADIIEKIAVESGLFKIALRQQRVFKNRFGQAIREDLLNFSKLSDGKIHPEKITHVARSIAAKALEKGQLSVSLKNRELLINALEKVQGIQGTPIFLSNNYRHYQTRDTVMMVKEEENL